MPRFTDEIVWPWELGAVPWVSGGDPDICTKPGRKTEVTIKVSNLRIQADRRSILAHVLYKVEEMRRNYTTLQYEGDVQIPVPYSWKVLQLLYVSDYSLRTTVVGQNHNWIDDTSNISNTCVNHVSYKIDDVGDDDRGNARLKLTFRIPVEVEGTMPVGAQRQAQEPEPAPQHGP